MCVDIIRMEYNDDCVRGVITVDRKIVCCSLELPDLNNQRSISCIPEGIYICKPFKSPVHGKVFHIIDVPERDSILIHSGNTHNDTEGCIIPGEKFGMYKRERAVLYSRQAMDTLNKVLKDKEYFLLNIRSV